MPSLSQLPGEVKQKRLTKALVRLGFRLDEKGGNGSHYKLIWKNEKSLTIPSFIPKQTLNYLLKEIAIILGLTWDDIKKEY